MDLKSLFNKGKRMVDKRGGADSLKEDAGELKDIAKGEGSLSDKAKDAAAAIKDPGAPGEEPGKGDGKADRPQQSRPGQDQGQQEPPQP